jgi:hypothetical protein
LSARHGTTLICVASNDGVFLAADDLVCGEQERQAVPTSNNFLKVCVMDNILIGTAGLMGHTAIKYDVQEWITDFANVHGNTPDKLPSSVAEAIYAKLKDTFSLAEPLVEQGFLKGYRPGGRLLSYVVAGYAKNFKQPYVFEVGVDISRGSDGLTCIAPIHHRRELPHNVRFGEDHFIERANDGLEPERSLFTSLVERVSAEVFHALPNIPPALQESLACTVSLIKVEANFNPQKIGSVVKIALIDRRSRAAYSESF